MILKLVLIRARSIPTLRFGLSICALALLACQSSEYELPATFCDEWCEQEQRANCRDDKPHECVTLCERAQAPYGALSGGRCRAEHLMLLECYRRLPDESFFCFSGKTHSDESCALERAALSRCFLPVSTRCMDVCEVWGPSCPDFEPRLCIETCVSEDRTPCPSERIAYFDCLLASPAECDHAPPAARSCPDLLARWRDCVVQRGGSN